ncbi:hypothetical protein EJ03DRAFT_186636 [Teratosphaeria nubilosa]|uniref:Uncharacterized protein n=1 Tax=Teratosphaeria nubilosa TaxID=161662 RepID=A0A6G1LIW3_9PEZI|nr:hypothetical protein EJ03DRAFT_186636 [Teratosphaeria nubilosa]
MLALFTLSLAAVATAVVEPQEACQSRGQGCALDCSPGSKDGLQSECWEFLNMTGYLQEWVAVNGSGAGIEKDGFAQAYLKWSGQNTLTCNLITSDTCTQPLSTATYQSHQQFYALWNIFAVYQFFNQYSTALTASQSLASSKLGQIVDKVAPPVEHITSTPEWYTNFGVGLYYAAIFVGPAFTAAEASAGISALASAIMNGIWAARATPPLGTVTQGYTQTAQQRVQTLANVGGDLADLVSQWQKQVVDEVAAMQNNIESFLALTSPGGFSERVTISLPQQSTVLYKSLELFTLAEALTASGVIIAKSTGIDPREVATATGEIQCPGFGPAGNCYDYFYDTANKNTYVFHDINNDQRDFTDLINFIWDQKIVDNMADIFANEQCSGKTPSLEKPDPQVFCSFNTKNCEYGTSHSLPEHANPSHC